MLGFSAEARGRVWPTGGGHGGPEEPGSLPSTCWSGATTGCWWSRSTCCATALPRCNRLTPSPFTPGWCCPTISTASSLCRRGDTDFPLRWRLIKGHFSRALPVNERRSHTRLRHGERGIWQRHYWEHLIQDERDYRHHMNYVHINPLKHGHVTRVADWPYSTFHRYVASGIYPPDWCGSVDGVLGGLE